MAAVFSVAALATSAVSAATVTYDDVVINGDLTFEPAGGGDTISFVRTAAGQLDATADGGFHFYSYGSGGLSTDLVGNIFLSAYGSVTLNTPYDGVAIQGLNIEIETLVDPGGGQADVVVLAPNLDVQGGLLVSGDAAVSGALTVGGDPVLTSTQIAGAYLASAGDADGNVISGTSSFSVSPFAGSVTNTVFFGDSNAHAQYGNINYMFLSGDSSLTAEGGGNPSYGSLFGASVVDFYGSSPVAFSALGESSITTIGGDFSWATAFGKSMIEPPVGIVSGDLTYATAGGESTASGHHAVALGKATALAPFTVALGHETVASADSSVALGMFNETTPTDWNQADELLAVGNGQDDANRSNALTILKNGAILIAPQGDIPMFDPNQ